jgi:hypothetical protein
MVFLPFPASSSTMNRPGGGGIRDAKKSPRQRPGSSSAGEQDPPGNLDAMRDRGHSRDYVQAMWLMHQQRTGGLRDRLR